MTEENIVNLKPQQEKTSKMKHSEKWGQGGITELWDKLMHLITCPTLDPPQGDEKEWARRNI